jgi:AcrR family transcriptional regulator
VASQTTRRRSPRRQQLLDVAARLFQARGYHNVSLEDIATEVGLTGPAVYRHFRNKHDLLAQLLTEQIGAVMAIGEVAVAADAAPQARLAGFLDDLVTLVLEREDTLLWKQERRHLTGDEQQAFRELARRVLSLTASVVEPVRPDLDAADRELLSWVILSASSQARTYRTSLSRARAEAFLKDAINAMIACDLGPAPAGPAPAVEPYTPFGRRERIMEIATRLLDGRGYYDVSIEEIASEADTAIATVYQYFGGKADLLHAVLARGVEGTRYAAIHSAWTAQTPEDRLERLVRSYVDLAFGPHGRLLGIFEADVVYLPDATQESLRRVEREHAQDWVEHLMLVRPDLSSGEARARVRTALGLVADLAQTYRQRTRADIGARAERLAWAVLRC